jgi:putrescine transport system substrate-binding protein
MAPGGARKAFAVVVGACAVLAACSRSPAPEPGVTEAQRTVHVLGWFDYIAPDAIPRFERETGIKVVYDVIDTNATLEAKLMAGNTGYDVVIPAGSFLSRQIPAKVYQPLDKSRLPNLTGVDGDLVSRLAVYDPGNRYSAPYLWGVHGIGIDVEKVRARLPDAAKDSWGLVFDPAQAAKLADCGISLFDSPHYMTLAVYHWLGLDPSSESAEDLARVDATLRAIRPYVRKIDSVSTISDMMSGEVCVSIISSGDIVQARDRSREAGRLLGFEFFIPREGATIWFDVMAIPADAPAPVEAHAFVNFMLEPANAAANTNAVGYPNAIGASRSLLRPELAADPAVYPPPAQLERTTVDSMPSPAAVRARNRVWTRFLTNDYR